MSEPDDLVERARQGSPEAFAELVRLYQSRVRSFLRRYVRDRDVVDDLAQDTFLTAYRALPSYTPEGTPGIWFLGIARNKALHFLRDSGRRSRRRNEIVESALGGWFTERLENSPPGLAEREREISALESCLRELPPHSADLVRDYYYKGRTAAQIAREEGRKHSAVWMALLRIREALRRCMSRRLGTAEGQA